MIGHPCRAIIGMPETYRCGRKDQDKPMCFRGTDWCCEDHRKLVVRQAGMEAESERSES